MKNIIIFAFSICFLSCEYNEKEKVFTDKKVEIKMDAIELKAKFDFEKTDAINSFINSIHKIKIWNKLENMDAEKYSNVDWEIIIPCYYLDHKKMAINKKPKDAFEYLTLEENAFEIMGFYDDKPIIHFEVESNPKCIKFPYNILVTDGDSACRYLENIKYAQKKAGKENIFRVRFDGSIYYGFVKNKKLNLISNTYTDKGFKKEHVKPVEVMNMFKKMHSLEKSNKSIYKLFKK